MTKLANIRAPRLDGKLPNRLTRDGNRDDVRMAEQPWRQWYGTQRWRKLAEKIKLRDLFQCQRCKRVAISIGKRALVADHITPHRGSPELFWDEGNLQTLCATCHSSVKQAEEARGREPAGCWY
jgi:5-methylcytosine-specific restriction endonuclease McrA